MHPRCARLPQIVRSSRHSEHDLTLVDADGCCAAAACAAAAGRAWYYRCTTCNVDLHVSCAAAAVGDNNGANAIVEQIHQASAAQTQILRAQMLANIRVQGARSMVGILSPSCKSPLASVDLGCCSDQILTKTLQFFIDFSTCIVFWEPVSNFFFPNELCRS